ncbi:MAG: MarR family transcriptional regulator [Aquisalimonadaceae bacterium]
MSKKTDTPVGAPASIVQRQEGPARVRHPVKESIGLLMRIALQGLRKSFSDQLDKHGIPWSAWYYLRVLWEDDGLIQSELVGRVGAMQPNAVAAIKTLKQLGLVHSEREQEDRRRIRVWLTPQGRELEQKVLPDVLAAVDQVAFRGFSETERETLRILLSRVCRNVSGR